MEEIKYNGKFVQVKERIIDGAIWEMAYIPNSLVVIPLTDEDEIIFIVEKRPHENPPQRLKLVTGHIDEGETLDSSRQWVIKLAKVSSQIERPEIFIEK